MPSQYFVQALLSWPQSETSGEQSADFMWSQILQNFFSCRGWAEMEFHFSVSMGKCFALIKTVSSLNVVGSGSC